MIGHALYAYLRLFVDTDLTLDGWQMFRILEENQATIRGVGIMYFLPAGQLPLEVVVTSDTDASHYRVLVGVDDDRWSSLSESKRWKAVYVYATTDRAPPWSWSNPIAGSAPLRQALGTRR